MFNVCGTNSTCRAIVKRTHILRKDMLVHRTDSQVEKERIPPYFECTITRTSSNCVDGRWGNMEERGRTVPAPVGTVCTRAMRALQRGGHGTTSPSWDEMCYDGSSPKQWALSSEARIPVEVSIMVVNRPAMCDFSDGNVCNGTTPLHALAHVEQTNGDGVDLSGSLPVVECRQPGKGGRSTLSDRQSTTCELYLRFRPVPAVREPWNNRSTFLGVAMEIRVSGTVEGSRIDADVGVVRNSDRTVGGSEMQLPGGKNVR